MVTKDSGATEVTLYEFGNLQYIM